MDQCPYCGYREDEDEYLAQEEFDALYEKLRIGDRGIMDSIISRTLENTELRAKIADSVSKNNTLLYRLKEQDLKKDLQSRSNFEDRYLW